MFLIVLSDIDSWRRKTKMILIVNHNYCNAISCILNTPGVNISGFLPSLFLNMKK